MSVIDSNSSFLDGEQASLVKIILGRLQPAIWPFTLDELPEGAALVGGSIRDAVLNRPQHKRDLDLVVPSGAIELAQRLAENKGGTCVVLDAKRDIARFVYKEWTVDIASQIGKSLNEDLCRRDFTINAIALKLLPIPEIFDPQGGLDDLKCKKLIAVTETNLIEDPLRLLRGFRLSAELNLLFDPRTIEFIRLNVKSLQTVAVERIKGELESLVNALWADQVIPLMQEIGLLAPWESKTNNTNRQLLSLTNISSLNANERDIAVPLIRLTNLLSDQGLEDLGFSRKKIKNSYLLRYWYNKNDEIGFENLTEFDRIKLHKELETILPALIIQLSNHDQKIWISRWRDQNDPLFHPSSPLNGNILKEILDVPQGPWIGELMSFLCKERAFGRLQNREDAVKSAFDWWKQNQPFCD